MGAQVLSQAQSAPAACAISATAAMSVILSSGFEGVSTQTSFVFGRTAFLTSIEVRHVDEAHFEAPPDKDLAQQLGHAVINIRRRDDMIAGRERLENRARRRQPGAKRSRVLAAFQAPPALPRARAAFGFALRPYT